MSSSQPLDIKVIYSASKRPQKPKRRPAPARAPKTRAKTSKAPAIDVSATPALARQTGTRPWTVLAVFNILIAGAMYYGIWWQADKMINVQMLLNTPIPGADADQIANMMFPGGAPDPNSDINLAQTADEEKPLFTGEAAAFLIAGSAYGWEAVSTIALCILALSAGTSIGRGTGSRWRRIGVILAVGGALWMAYVTYDTWTRYKLGYQSSHLRAGMGVLVLWFVLVGIAVDRGHRKWLRRGAWSLIVAGLVTGLALFVGNQCDAIGDEWATPKVLIVAFVAHSLYGWILLPVSARLKA